MRMPFLRNAMSRLGELQQAFVDAVMDGKPQRLVTEIAPSESALRTIALYRRAIRFNYTQVLKITYPVLSQLMGRTYFEALARGYLQVYPSRSGDLFFYGGGFPSFLQDVQAGTWLIDLARLEWGCHVVSQAADPPPGSPEENRDVRSGDPASVRVHLHPASHLLRLAFPVHRIWQGWQSDDSGDVDVQLPLPEEQSHVIVIRNEAKIQILPLAYPEYLALEAMSQGMDVATVEQMVDKSQPGFDFSGFMVRALQQRVITGWSSKEVF